MNVATIELIVALLGAGWVLLAIWLVVVTVRLRKLANQQKVVAKAGENGDFVDAVSRSLSELGALGVGLEQIKDGLAQFEADLKDTVRNVGLVRFDAFDDTGGKLSFAVALLDGHGDGVVVSAINGRQDSRTYAKLVQRGDSTYNLSAEEREAIAEALAGARVKV